LIQRLLVDSSRKVRETIFTALDRIDSEEVIKQVARMLDSDDAFLRNQAVGLLQRKGEAAVPVLLARMRDPDPDVRKFVLDTAAASPSKMVEPIFDAAMRDDDVNVVIAALEHLGEQRKTRFKTDVEEIFLKATEPMLVCSAFATLLKIGDTDSWRCIRQRYPTAANVPDWKIGSWIRALGDFGMVGEIAVFHELLERYDGAVAWDTIDALERFQSRHGRIQISAEFWNLLRKMLEEKLAPEVKLQLFRVVGGFAAPLSITNYLVASLEKGDQITKLGAIEAIKRLGQTDLLGQFKIQFNIETNAEVAEALLNAGRTP
jgi:HEAT repeat protein